MVKVVSYNCLEGWNHKKLAFCCGVFLLVLQWCLATNDEINMNHSPANDTDSSVATPTGCKELENMSNKEPWEESLLPKDVIPEVYDLFLFPHLDQGVFEGNVKITVKLLEPKNLFILHSQGLEIDQTKVFKEGNEEIKVSNTFEWAKNQYWVIQLYDTVPVGAYNIILRFSGKLTGKNIGFYRSSYKGKEGNLRHIATTKFEPTYARQAFPCFDEPILKAKYKVRLARQPGYIALSNMNVVAETENNPVPGITTVEFGLTPPMSTYYTCFIVCDFDHLEPVILENQIPLTVYAQPGQIKNMKFTRDLAAKAIDFYAKYFEITYPLPKLDLIAIPDFVSGAMENWGLITFRETLVLITEGESNTVNYEQVADTVSHELAHMWFGDLVTMAWWDDLWLNEGFATFLTMLCVKNIFPQWELEGISLLKNKFSVMSDDAALSSHSIIQKVSHPDQISEMFDAISYRKGASVLVMLESLDPEKFRKGVSNYLKHFQYGNARTEDLWTFIQREMNHFNVSGVMKTWTEQMGYPLVQIEQKDNKLVFKQDRFLADANASFSRDSSPFRYQWDIPITFISSKNPEKVENFFLNRENQFVEKAIEPGTEWFKVNHNLKGFYRVNYTVDAWKQLEKLFKENVNSLNAADRANILDDLFSLSEAGYLNYRVPFSFISYIKKSNESSSAPLMVLSKHLNSLKIKLINTTCYPNFKKYIQTVLEPLISDSLWDIQDEDSFELKRVKLSLLSMACRFEISSTLNKARKLFSLWLEGKSDKPQAQIRSLVYNYGIDGEHVVHNWEKLWNVYLNETNPEEKVKFRRSLASVNKTELISKLLQLAKNENYVRSQDYFPFLSAVADNPNGVGILWDFIKSEWKYLVQRFTLNDRYLGRLIPIVTSDFSTKTLLEEVTTFFKQNPDAGAGANGRKNALESIQNNIKWNEKNLPIIENWLQNPPHS